MKVGKYIYVKKIKIRNLQLLKIGRIYYCDTTNNGISVQIHLPDAQNSYYTISEEEFENHFCTNREYRKLKLNKLNENR